MAVATERQVEGGVDPRAAGSDVRVLSTLNADGSRRWLRPRPSPGRFLTWRRAVAYLLIIIFTAIPYIRLHGKPLILLDLTTRQFTIFGKTFLPTDTLLLSLLLVAVFVAVFLATALFGRVWCGWACPQTVYMEFVYRPIERLFEGTPGRRKAGLLAGTALGKVLKFALFLLVSLYLAHTFLAYFVGVENLRQWVTQSPLRHPGPFLVMAAVTVLMLFDFGYFREQTCIVACPYGRFQSVMLDRGSLIISYDAKRGEPRGKASRAVSLPVVQRGDCVDCGLCVQTCPTGIDIRNGLQMECIGCAQCIDACDAVMTRLSRPRGLIRYSSPAAMEGAKVRRFRPRVIVYPVVLGVVLAAFFALLATKSSADVRLIRGLGAPFSVLPSGEIANVVKLRIVNRSRAEAEYLISVEGIEGAHLVAEVNPVRLSPDQSRVVPVTVEAPSVAFAGTGWRDVALIVEGPDRLRKVVRFRMMGPGTARPVNGEGGGA